MAGRRSRTIARMLGAAILVATIPGAGGCTSAEQYASRLLFHECPAVSWPTWFGVLVVGVPPTVALAPVTVPIGWLLPKETFLLASLSPLIVFGGTAGVILGTPPYLIGLPFEDEDETAVLEEHRERQRRDQAGDSAGTSPPR